MNEMIVQNEKMCSCVKRSERAALKGVSSRCAFFLASDRGLLSNTRKGNKGKYYKVMSYILSFKPK